MSRKMLIPVLVAAALFTWSICEAQYVMPQAPATVSWLPHGYGANMHLINSPASRMKGLHGFRTTPEHIGCWSQPLWGWDVNGFYRGPQVPEVDPCRFQLPIGLLYPDNAPMMPPPRRVKRAAVHMK